MLHGKNLEITPAIRDFVEEKIGSLSRFLPGSADDLIEARVEIGRPSHHHRTGFVFYAEANLKVGKKLFRAVEEHIDLRAAIDRVRDELETQIKKFKEKTNSSQRRVKEV